MRSDLATDVLWRLDVRFATALLLGLLLTGLFVDLDDSDLAPDSWLLALAFISGVVPDAFLVWLSQQAFRLINRDGRAFQGIFSPSDFQKKITGLNFWQVDRLAEEGIESIPDLAMKDLPDLLIHTRFDPALLFDWVDRALLWHQADSNMRFFERANMPTASQLIYTMKRADSRGAGLRNIKQSLKDTEGLAWDRTTTTATTTSTSEPSDTSRSHVLSTTLLENVIRGLELMPNLHHLLSYWEQVGHVSCRLDGTVAANASHANPTTDGRVE